MMDHQKNSYKRNAVDEIKRIFVVNEANFLR